MKGICQTKLIRFNKSKQLCNFLDNIVPTNEKDSYKKNTINYLINSAKK